MDEEEISYNISNSHPYRFRQEYSNINNQDSTIFSHYRNDINSSVNLPYLQNSFDPNLQSYSPHYFSPQSSPLCHNRQNYAISPQHFQNNYITQLFQNTNVNSPRNVTSKPKSAANLFSNFNNEVRNSYL